MRLQDFDPRRRCRLQHPSIGQRRQRAAVNCTRTCWRGPIAPSAGGQRIERLADDRGAETTPAGRSFSHQPISRSRRTRPGICRDRQPRQVTGCAESILGRSSTAACTGPSAAGIAGTLFSARAMARKILPDRYCARSSRACVSTTRVDFEQPAPVVDGQRDDIAGRQRRAGSAEREFRASRPAHRSCSQISARRSAAAVVGHDREISVHVRARRRPAGASHRRRGGNPRRHR